MNVEPHVRTDGAARVISENVPQPERTIVMPGIVKPPTQPSERSVPAAPGRATLRFCARPSTAVQPQQDHGRPAAPSKQPTDGRRESPAQPEESAVILQIDRRPDTEIRGNRSSVRRPRDLIWSLALLIAIVISGIAGLTVAAHPSGPATETRTVHQEPNANTRASRVPTPTLQETNANAREGRVPTPTVRETNANAREGRVPAPTVRETNANAREGRVQGNS
jgi:hypothetical protein